MNLEGKVAIVTGGMSGIGYSVVKKLLENGSKVIVADISDNNINELAKLNNSNVRFLKTDISNESEVKLLVERTVKTYGTLDYMVCCAGISSEKTIDIEPIEDYKRVQKVDEDGTYYCNKYAIIEMLKHHSGSIVNVASILGLVGQMGAHSYTMAKGAVVNLTRSLGITYAKDGIRVNAVAPGYINTPMTKDLDEQTKKYQIMAHPIGRCGEPEEVANAIYFLLSDESSFITGVTLPVDGGYTSK